MKGKIKFDRKDPVMEVDDFEVIAVEILPHSVFTGFQRNMLNDYDFIVPFADDMHVDSNDIAHAMLVLDEEGEDGILIIARVHITEDTLPIFPKQRNSSEMKFRKLLKPLLKADSETTEMALG